MLYVDWIHVDTIPFIRHPRVQSSDGGGLCPEQHYGVLTDGRTFYFRYRHGEASLQVLHRPEGVCDLPVTNPEFDREAFKVAINNSQDYAGPPFWAQPKVWVTVSEEDDGYFQDDEEKEDTFTRLMELIDEYDQDLAAREYAGEFSPLAQESPWA